MILWLVLALAHDGPRHLPAVIHARLPAPIRALTDGPDQVCLTIEPTLSTPDVAFDEGDYGASCTSDAHRTTACLSIAPGAVWPGRLPDLECKGDGHVLRIAFVAGYDPHEDISDGVVLVRLRGPEDMAKTMHARFAAPGWPDADGIMEGGQCRVHQGVFEVRLLQDDNRSRALCTLVEEHGDEVVERHVPVRVVERLR